MVLSNDCPKNTLKSDYTHLPGQVEPIFYLKSLGNCVGVHGTHDNSLSSLLRTHVIHLCLPQSDQHGSCTGGHMRMDGIESDPLRTFKEQENFKSKNQEKNPADELPL